MVQVYVETARNVSFINSYINFHKMFIESFKETSLRLVNNSNSYCLGFWQMYFKENIF